MCTLLLYRRPLPGVELAVAANRDELSARPPGEWARLGEAPEVWGGRDPEAGGTWLALSAAGFLVAVTNARLGARRGPEQRSRGLLALDLARSADAAAAAAALGREDLARYAPVDVVVAWPEGFEVATNLPRPEVRRVEERALGLGNRPAFEPDPRVAALLELGRPGGGEDPEEWRGRLAGLLARHADPSACHHTPAGGTVSATVALLEGRRWRVWHAAGAPCRTPFARVPAPGSRPPSPERDVKHA